jgi:hypothetical protein
MVPWVPLVAVDQVVRLQVAKVSDEIETDSARISPTNRASHSQSREAARAQDTKKMAAASDSASSSPDGAAGTRLSIVEVAEESVGHDAAAAEPVAAPAGGERESKERDEVDDTAGASTGASEDSSAFTFMLQPDWRLSAEKDKKAKELWTKWGLEESLVVRKFAFSRRLDLGSATSPALRKTMLKSLLRDLLSDPVVRSAIPLRGTPRTGNMLPSTGLTDVAFEELRTTRTSMEFFDRLEDDDIVVAPMWPTPEEMADADADESGVSRSGAGGYVRKQFDVVVDGVTCQDHLRDVLVNPDTEHVGVSLARGASCLVPAGSFVQLPRAGWLRTRQLAHSSSCLVPAGLGRGNWLIRPVASSRLAHSSMTKLFDGLLMRSQAAVVRRGRGPAGAVVPRVQAVCGGRLDVPVGG